MSVPDEDFCDECEPDELEEAMGNCHQFVGRDGYLHCGAQGSTDCDACPVQCDIGKRVAKASP